MVTFHYYKNVGYQWLNMEQSGHEADRTNMLPALLTPLYLIYQHAHHALIIMWQASDHNNAKLRPVATEL